MENQINSFIQKFKKKMEYEFSNNDIYKNNIECLSNRYSKKIIDDIKYGYKDKIVEIKKSRAYYKIQVKKDDETKRIFDRYYDNQNEDILTALKKDIGEFQNGTIFIVYGFGMGYHVSEIFRIMGENNSLLIIEPDVNVFNEAIKFNTFKELFSSSKVHIALGDDINSTKIILNMIINYKNKMENDIKLVLNKGYDRAYLNFYKLILEEIKLIASRAHENFFPLKSQDNTKTFIGESIFETNQKKACFAGYYNELSDKFSASLYSFYKTELLYGKKHDSGYINLNINEKAILPVYAVEPNTKIELKIDNEHHVYDNIRLNTFNYFPVDEGDIDIKVNKDIVVGKPIPLIQNKKHKTKLVLYMFLDGLAKYALNKNIVKDMMPNTMKFFSKGAKFNNCFFNAEWTLPSVPTIFSGKYASKHKIFHPNSIPYPIGYDYPILSEYFQNEEYLTFQICGDWRKNPLYGYVKGFDRTIYKRGMDYKDVIFAFLEQMRAFKDRDQFGWISLFDLHDITYPIPDISDQIKNSLDAHNYEDSDKKSVYKEYNEAKSEMYLNKANRLDSYLKIIYDYIEENYNEDEVIVVLCTDHGQTYLGNDSHPLNDSRAKIPLLIKGRGIPDIEVDELVENVDILPTVLTLNDIKFDKESIDGRIPSTLGGDKERDYVYYESIYPNKTFKAVVRDRKHKLLFETEEKVTQDGRIRIGKYKTSLINLQTKKDEAVENKSKVDKYVDVILSNIKDITILDK